ncbi:MAG: hypothetical protein AMXMBFR64_05830 [Myxococcales bacterium]
MTRLDFHDVVYDWNVVDKTAPMTTRPIELYDETLRDGIQSPSAKDPTIDEKIELLHLMEKLGIQWADLGLPGAGQRAQEDVEILCREIVQSKLKIRPSTAARTVIADIEPIVAISQRVGIEIEVMAFIGSSPIRQYTEGWDVEKIERLSTTALRFAAENGLLPAYVTEDTCRSRPETLGRLFRSAIEAGARRLCLCDTVGHATPDGVRRLVGFTRNLVDSLGVDVGVEWHGHNDRGLALPNALFAVEAGVDRVHGTARGIGERVGNTPMDLLLVNLRLLGVIDNDLAHLDRYTKTAAAAMGIPIPADYPAVGHDAFRTATGVHAAAIIKAARKGDAWLADHVYSGVPASMVGREQDIEVGHYSGESNVVYWLERRGIEPERDLVHAVFSFAKHTNRVLSEPELHAFIEEYRTTGTHLR